MIINRNKFLILAVVIIFICLIQQADTKTIRTETNEIIVEELLAPGIIHRNFLIKIGKYTHSVHVIEADLVNPFLGVAVLKAKNQVNELDKLHNIIHNWDSLHPHLRTVSAINANFWTAYSNRPIGPTIIDGEILEIITHKQWSSAFFDKISFMYIDTFFIEGKLIIDGKTFNIDYVNRRSDSIGIVLYNHFGGDIIPYVPTRTIKNAIAGAQEDGLFDDSTEAEFSKEEFIKNLKEDERNKSIENKLRKLIVQYIDKPTINREYRCVIKNVINSGSAKMPFNGAIISIGDDEKINFKLNDTIKLKFSTNVYDSIEFQNAISGTPRLVRQGKITDEAKLEGSRGRRFIYKELSRTAIGCNKMKNKVYFVTVESTDGKRKIYGANLKDMSYIMHKIGCYEAINLDGGGSTTLIINGNNLMRTNPKSSRMISVGLGIYIRQFGQMK